MSHPPAGMPGQNHGNGPRQGGGNPAPHPASQNPPAPPPQPQGPPGNQLPPRPQFPPGYQGGHGQQFQPHGQFQPGGQFQQGPGGHGHPPGHRRPSKAPKRLMIAGVIVIALGLIIGLPMAINGFRTATEAESLLQPFNSETMYHADGGAEFMIYSQGSEVETNCVVKRPDGEVLEPELGRTSTVNQWEATATYSSPFSGNNLITCIDDRPRQVGPAVSVSGILGAVFGTIGAVFALLIGGVLLIIGLIMRVNRR